ncbi:Non-structural maintenance of chromosomes element 1 [Coemansia aciculifera]|uniref:Non-structural maintenance of chromosomes element 1 n=1 Tax=Coemansia aciculifera TaxID=417176 RepID=A0ACC1M412_9FUNG|nr:Non-structural maintenance of chromosomes element 1 [Coemansia aciculifera]
MATRPASVEQQQMLVQWCMSAQVFSEPAFRRAIKRITTTSNSTEEDDGDVVVVEGEAEGGDVDLHGIVEVINESMRSFSLELRSCMEQTSGVRMWALSNTNADGISTGATPYSASELSVLKTLIEGVVTEAQGNYSLTLHDALRMAANVGGSRAEALQLIRKFSNDAWLSSDDGLTGGYVCLGERSIIELQSFFSSGFADYVRMCSLCKEMATCGVVCMECLEPVHPYCAVQLASASLGDQLACPACNKIISQPRRRFGPGERGVPHELLLSKEGGDGEEEEEPATQSIKKLRIEDSDGDWGGGSKAGAH